MYVTFSKSVVIDLKINKTTVRAVKCKETNDEYLKRF